MRLNKLALLLIAFLLPASAWAQGSRVPCCSCGVPSQTPRQWQIRHTTPTFQDAANQAFNTWNLYADIMRTSVPGNPNAFALGNGQNELVFADFSDVEGLEGVVGIALQQPSEAFGDFNECPKPSTATCGTFLESDVLINSEINWYAGPVPTNDNQLDYGYYMSTAIHEIGHTTGFHHSFKNLSTMNYYQDYAGQYVSRADVLGLRAQFPSQTRQVSDLGTYPFSYSADRQIGSAGIPAVIPANVSPSSIAAGGKFVVKNWTMENLGNNPSTGARLRFYLSLDTNITTSDIPVGGFEFTSGALTTWSEDYTGTEFTLPAGVPAGSYYFGAIAGTVSGSTITTDSITYNNTWYLPARVTIGGGGPITTPCAEALASGQTCLVGSRFEVKVSYNSSDGVVKPMTAIKYTPDSALFWFNNSSNIEVLVKMVNACGVLNNRYWVFIGGTTDVRVLVTVRDTRNGTLKTYENTLGQAFVTRNDTNAFATCP